MDSDAYHAMFPPHILQEARLICHLEALNVVVTVKGWEPHLAINWSNLFLTISLQSQSFKHAVVGILSFWLAAGKSGSLVLPGT